MSSTADKIKYIEENLSKFLHSINFTKAVVGLSGGVDSALVAKLAVNVLGKENVMAIHMPYDGLTADQNTKDAEDWAKELGISFEVIEINAFTKPFDSLPWNASDLASMNSKARVRANILYHYANSHDAIVLGTGNKTESMLGYCTKYGDGAVDVQPIATLYKTEVWEAAKLLNLPRAIIEKTPTAELVAGQTDEGDIGMSYAAMDRILKDYELGNGPITDEEISIHKRIQNNRHKSEMPPVIDCKPWEEPKMGCCGNC
ncbi:NAD+ synthase [Candidatus Peregrinibacteria bacterium]|nr:MAG: NAD+ synthase [Candidatus Peregrinibacteria bacterium]